MCFKKKQSKAVLFTELIITVFPGEKKSGFFKMNQLNYTVAVIIFLLFCIQMMSMLNCQSKVQKPLNSPKSEKQDIHIPRELCSPHGWLCPTHGFTGRDLFLAFSNVSNSTHWPSRITDLMFAMCVKAIKHYSI